MLVLPILDYASIVCWDPHLIIDISNNWSQLKHLPVVLLQLVVGQPQLSYVLLQLCHLVPLSVRRSVSKLTFCISVLLTLPLYVMIFYCIEFLVVIDCINYS